MSLVTCQSKNSDGLLIYASLFVLDYYHLYLITFKRFFTSSAIKESIGKS